MASTGKKGKKSKGKTVTLTVFLAEKASAPAPIPPLAPRKPTSWSDEIDEAESLNEFVRKPVLPTAPRAARAVDFDENQIPKNPPYVAYISNLSYEIEESDICEFFKDLSISNVRLPRDERSGRLKGFGYVEFSDRLSFISALQIFENTIKGRRIRIEVADNNEGDRRRGQRDNRDRDSNYDPEKTAGDWRSGPRSELPSADDRRGPSSGPRRDYGGFKERDGDRPRGFGDRDREMSSWRDSERRFQPSDRDGRDSRESRDVRDGRDGRDSRGFGRRNYDDRERDREPGPSSEPRSRPKLQLQPRTLPREEIVIKEEPPLSREEPAEDPGSADDRDEPRADRPSAPPAASIFGQAKPVDTAAREREIEARLAKERDGGERREPREQKHHDDLPPKREEADEPHRNDPAPEPKENVWHRRTQRIEEDDTTSNQENKNGRRSPAPDHEQPRSGPRDIDHGGDEESTKADADEDRDSDRSRVTADRDRENERDRDRLRKDDKYRPGDRDRRYSDGKDGDRGRYNTDRDRDRDGDAKRYQERDSDGAKFRQHDDYGGQSKGGRGEKRGGGVGMTRGGGQAGRGERADKGPPPARDRPARESREPRKQDDVRMPKYKEVAAPNYVGTNKYSFLDEDGSCE